MPAAMSNGHDLTKRMREDWDSRIAQDFRYWMSDGVESDDEMWAAGRRDLEILLKHLEKSELKTQKALEVGCGVGNFTHYPDSLFLDKLLKWELIYRTREELQELFAPTPFGDQMTIIAEPNQVNLFAVATKE